MKKILKTAVVLLSAGIIATPAFALEWGVSGQVRVNWDVLNSSSSEYKYIDQTRSETTSDSMTDYNYRLGEEVKQEAKSDSAGTGAAHGDSFVTFSLTGDNGVASMTYYANGVQDFIGTASVEEDGWTASMKATQRLGDEGKADNARDNFVSLANERGFSLKMGHYTPLDTFRQGAGNLLMGEKGQVGAFDTRSSVSEFGFKVSDALNVGVAIEQGADNAAFGAITYSGYTPKFSDGAVKNDWDKIGRKSMTKNVTTNTKTDNNIETKTTTTTTNTGPNLKSLFSARGPEDGKSTSMGIGNMGIKANFNTDALSAGVLILASGETGTELEVANKDNLTDSRLYNKDAKTTASGVGLGVKYNLGALTPFLNIWNSSVSGESFGHVEGSKTEVKTDKSETNGVSSSSSTKTTMIDKYGIIKDERTASSMQLGVDFGPLGFGFSTYKDEYTVTTPTELKQVTAVTGATPMYDSVTGTEAKTKAENSSTAIELGYNGKLGATLFKVGFVSKTDEEKITLRDESKPRYTTTTPSQLLRIRLQHSF